MENTKIGTTLNKVTGNSEWFLVEYNDGSATVHATWDEAFTAGSFKDDSAD